MMLQKNMTQKKKLLAVALGAALFGMAAQSANAAITLAGAAGSNIFAQELANDEVTITNAAGNLNASAPVTSFGLTTTQSLYITVSLDQGAKFAAVPTVHCSGAGGGSVPTAAWNLGGIGAATAVFNLTTALMGAADSAVSGACSISGASFTNVTGNISPITMTVGYTYGTLGVTSTQTGTLITFQKGVSASVTPASNIAEVASGFTAFTAASSATSTAHMGTINIAGTTTAAYGPDGTTVATAANVIGTATITLTGPSLLAARSVSGIYLVSAGQACAGGAVLFSVVTAANPATFTLTSANINNSGYEVCMTVSGAAIPVDTITASITATGQAGTGGGALLRKPNVTVNAATVSTITRNGTTLIAPLVQSPGGTWLSRMVLTNTGGSATYTVTAVNEAGKVTTLTGAAASGTLAANSNTVIDLPTLMSSSTGANRTAFSVVVAGTNANITGLYQIVDPTGAVSNHVMANK